MTRPLQYLFFFLVFVLLLTGYFHPITAYSQDLGRHLLTGKIILSEFAVPKTNLYSYTFPDFSFINHHWLSEVIFYCIHSLTGDLGLQLISMSIVFMAFGLLFFFAVKKSSYLIASFVSIFYLRILFERTDLRPELFSFLFLSLFIVILYRYREKFTKLIYLLIPLELLWVNLHIYFFVGIVVLFLFFLDELIRKREDLTNPHTKTIGIVLILSLAVTVINPNGFDGALYPLRVFQNYGYAIEENQTIFLLEQLGFHKPSLPYFKFSIVMLFLSLGIMWKKTRPIDWLLALTFSYAGAVAVRNLPLFVFATFIPFCTALFHMREVSLLKQRTPKKIFTFFPLVILLLLLWQIHTVWQMHPIGLGVTRGAERGASFFLNQNLKGPIFNNFDIGSYLLYRFYPKEKVFIDGRPEAYPKDFIQNTYIPMQQNPALFNQTEHQFNIQTIFFSHTDQTPWAEAFLKQILTDQEWMTVYLDDTVIILVKNTPSYAAIINKFGMTQNALRVAHFDPNDKQSLLRLASFFNKTAQTSSELQMYQYLLAIEPDNCPVLYNTAAILSAHNDPSAHIYALKYQQLCKT